MNNDRKTGNGDMKVSMTRMKANKIKRKRILMLTAFLSAFALIVVTIIAAVFLKVGAIEVRGNNKYGIEDIISVAGIKHGESMIAVNGKETEDRLLNEFPAIKKVKIIKRIPSRVVIEVTESEEVLFVAFGEHYYSLDSELKVIDMYDNIESAEVEGMKRIYIPGVKRCITGEKIETEDGDIPEMIQVLYENLVKYGLFAPVSEIDFRDKFGIEFSLGVQYTVKLGNTLECSTKIEFLKGITEKLGPEYIGTIDLTGDNIKEAVFSRG